jgi:hypothetical protein
MMRKVLLLAAIGLPLAACGYSYGSTGYGYDRYSSSRYGYNPIVGAIGALGGAYGGYGFSQSAAQACASVASRYGPVRVTSVRQSSYDRVKVYGYAQRGFRTDNWDCTFRSDGRITDFDI